MREGLLLFAPVKVVSAQQKFFVADGGGHAEPDQLILVGVGQRAKKDPVDDTEHGSGRADAEGDGGDDRESKGRLTRGTPDGVAEVLQKLVDKNRCVHRTHLLLNPGGVAEALAGVG